MENSDNFKSYLRIVKPKIEELLIFCSKYGCSDLFITVGEPAVIYRWGILYQCNGIIDEIAWNEFASVAITSELNTTYVRQKFVDFSYVVKNKYRYRVNAGFSKGKNIATFRMISERIPTFTSLHLDKNVVNLLQRAFSLKQGVSMLVGATGSGKTSTLAACINTFSANPNSPERTPLKDANLITLEDPIEYSYKSTGSTRVTQKELGRDFMSFELGIKSALREHPTHILVGETRDRDTIRALVEASRTGHACITTFHTSTVSDTIARLYSYLAGENQDVMFDLVANLNFILAQELIKGRKGYTLNYQYMFFTEEIKKVLVEALYKNMNMSNVVEKLVQNKVLQDQKLCQGWLIERKR